MYLWAAIIVIILTWSLVVAVKTDDTGVFGIGLLVSGFTAFCVFVIYGLCISDGTRTTESIKEFDTKEYPEYVLISTPKGETYKITTMADKNFFETNKQFYYVWSTNHYGNATTPDLTVRP